MIRCCLAVTLVFVAASLSGAASSSISPSHIKGRYDMAPGVALDGGRITWQSLRPEVISVWRFDEQGGRVHAFLDCHEHPQIDMVFPKGAAEQKDWWYIDTGEATMQFDDGTWLFSAKDATLEGDAAKLESDPGHHRIGFWSNADDSVHWPMKATRWGMYEVELVYSLAGEKSNDIAIDIGDHELKTTIAPTGSWYDYISINLGRVYFDTADEREVRVRCTKLNGGAVMNLKAVFLRPSHEGEDAITKADPRNPGKGIVLHSSNATVLGKTLRYEPNPKKITLGYWANPKDTARFRFKPAEAGEYDVHILQGCGQGHGGSNVELQFSHGETLKFTVEDTGHWQNFKDRTIGRITIPAEAIKEGGIITLNIVPTKKAKGAVMDLREVRLVRRSVN